MDARTETLDHPAVWDRGNLARFNENVGALSLKLSTEELREIDGVSSTFSVQVRVIQKTCSDVPASKCRLQPVVRSDAT